MWRALNNCLPTKYKLRTRMVQVDNICLLYGSDTETTAHCLIHRLFAKNCWNLIFSDVSFDSSWDLVTWYSFVMEQMKEKVAKISVVCWSIRRARNDVTWNNKNVRAGNVVSAAVAYLSQWQDVQKKGNLPPISMLLQQAVLNVGRNQRVDVLRSTVTLHYSPVQVNLE